MCDERESSPDFIVWSDEDTFKLNGTVNHHNCVYQATENPRVTEERAVNLPGVSVWCGLSSRGLIGKFLSTANDTGTVCLSVLQDNTVLSIKFFFEEKYYFQQDGAPPHDHNYVSNFLNVLFPGRRAGRRVREEYPPLSPDFTYLDYYLWGNVKNIVYAKKSRTLQDLRHTTETACTAIPLQFKTYATLLQVVNKAMTLAVSISNTCDIKESKKIMH
jgi:hypothetical protein